MAEPWTAVRAEQCQCPGCDYCESVPGVHGLIHLVEPERSHGLCHPCAWRLGYRVKPYWPKYEPRWRIPA